MSNTPPPTVVKHEEPQASSARANSAGAATPPERPGFFARQLVRARLFFKLNIPLFFYLNFFCRRVRRQKGKRIIPYRGTQVRIAKTARINLAGSLLLNADRYPHSRLDCLVRLDEGAVWDVNGYIRLRGAAIVEVYRNAHLVTGNYITANYGLVITCAKKITMGNYIAMARMTFISDSDLHPVYNSEGKRINEDMETVIEDHVWIGLKSTIMKGSHIETGAVVSANSLVSGKVPARTINASIPARPVVKDIYWER